MRNLRNGLFVFAFAVTLIILSGILLAAAKIELGPKSNNVPDEIIIDNKGYSQDRKRPVLFTHSNHSQMYNISCDACHHRYEDGKNVWKESDPVNKCNECHDPLKTDENVKKLKLAYHRSCIGCHSKLSLEMKSTDAPYKQCYKCHKRTEQIPQGAITILNQFRQNLSWLGNGMVSRNERDVTTEPPWISATFVNYVFDLPIP